jgi:photoactive yellow protein
MTLPASEAPPSFDAPYLAQTVARMDEATIHALPYGVIRLDRAGSVVFFSETEAHQSGFGPRPTLGRHYFTEIAPCMGNADFLGRIERAQLAGALDIEFSYVGDFDDADKELRCRVQSAQDGGIWIFTQRL